MEPKSYLSVAKIVASTSVDGPGLRTSLYLQGCNVRCKGCHNKALWDINEGELLEVNEVYEKLIETDENISILGGEPLMQYETLVKLCRKIKANTDREIWLWSGFTLGTIQIHFPEILDVIDVLVDGPFMEDLADPNLRFRGSSNQNIIPISPIAISKYSEYK